MIDQLPPLIPLPAFAERTERYRTDCTCDKNHQDCSAYDEHRLIARLRKERRRLAGRAWGHCRSRLRVNVLERRRRSVRPSHIRNQVALAIVGHGNGHLVRAVVVGDVSLPVVHLSQREVVRPDPV